MSEKELFEELLRQEDPAFWQCPSCGLTFDSEDELDEHLERCPVYNEKKAKVENTKGVVEEHKETLEKMKERIKLEILANASLEELNLFLSNPEALEKRVKERMIGEALKHPFVRSQSTLYEGFREKQLSEVSETLRLGVCPVCKMAFGSENGLLKHLQTQTELGEENHRKAKEYIDIVMNPDDVLKEFFEKKDSKEEEKTSMSLSREELTKWAKEEEKKQRLKEAVILEAILRRSERRKGRPPKKTK